MIENRKHYYGGCPDCGGTDGYLNVGSAHWFVCDAHKTRWLVGQNLFSDWFDQSEEDQQAIWNRRGIDDYRVVEPLPIIDGVFNTAAGE